MTSYFLASVVSPEGVALATYVLSAESYAEAETKGLRMLSRDFDADDVIFEVSKLDGEVALRVA